MPRLDNAKHEAYALNIVKGMKQINAYAHAGYSPNPSAASRMATMPMIADRIEELKVEIRQKMKDAIASGEIEEFESLQEMGLTVPWVARQYKEIYEEAMRSGSLTAANAAVQNIQKMIDIEKDGGGGGPEQDTAPAIKINEVTDMLIAVKALVQVGQKEGSRELDTMKDITPEQILSTRGVSNDDDHQ